MTTAQPHSLVWDGREDHEPQPGQWWLAADGSTMLAPGVPPIGRPERRCYNAIHEQAEGGGKDEAFRDKLRWAQQQIDQQAKHPESLTNALYALMALCEHAAFRLAALEVRERKGEKCVGCSWDRDAPYKACAACAASPTPPPESVVGDGLCLKWGIHIKESKCPDIPIAAFAFRDQADEWAVKNYPGRWERRPFAIDSALRDRPGVKE